MEELPYQTLIKTLKSEEDIINLSADTDECFYLDYKETRKDDYKNDKSIKDSDLKNIAKAISGFGNALGGLLIFGVAEKNKKRIVKPFRGYENFAVLVQECISRTTNPHHEKIETFGIKSEKEKDKGFIVVVIHQSQNKPLQVITNQYNHRYFYRSGESHIDIPHDVLVGMLGKKIPVKLICFFTSVSDEETKNNFSFSFVIQNKSSIIAQDVWFNIDVKMPNVSILDSGTIKNFTVFRLGDSMSMISNKDFRMPPQGYISSVKISIPKNKLEDDFDYHLYFTFGCEGSRINEFEAKFKGKEFNLHLNKNTEEMITFLKSKSPGLIVEKI